MSGTLKMQGRALTSFGRGCAFARSGGEQAGYGQIAVDALNLCVKDVGTYDNFIVSPSAGSDMWIKFVKICEIQFQHLYHEKGFGENEKLNKPVVQGIIDLAKTSIHYNPFEELYYKLPSDIVTGFFLFKKYPRHWG